MGGFTGFQKTGFNTTGNNQASMSNYNSGRSIYAVGLGRMRSTPASITRKFNYCNLNAPDLNVAFRCTFDIPNKSTPEDGNYITIVCQNGAILVSTDGGKNFTPKLTTPPISSLFQVSMSDTGRFQLVSDVDVNTQNSLYISTDFGQTFIEPKIPPSVDLAFISLAISRTGEYQTVVSKQNDNLVYYSKDFGFKWYNSNELTLPSSPSEKLQIIGVSMNNLGTIQLALCITADNSMSYLFFSIDFGVTWNLLGNSGILATLFSINLSDNGKYITAGEYQTAGNTSIYYGTLSGTGLGINFSGWTQSSVELSSTPSIFNVVSDYSGIIQMAIGGYSFGQLLNNSYVYISGDYGENWKIAKIPGQENYYWLSCSISKDGSKLVAIACDTISNQGSYDIPDKYGKFYYYYSFDGGITWKSTQLPSNYPGVGIYIN